MPTTFPTGLLIAIEGIDGAGKTTQVELLHSAFTSVGEEVVTSKEPTNGPWGRKIKDSAASGRMPLDEELTAFIEDRSEHVASRIIPSLLAGRVVILDRYFYSTIAYQGSRGGDATAVAAKMEALFPIPDAVFVLDLDPKISLHRIYHSRNDTPNEFERIEGLRKARDIFRDLPGDHVHILDATRSIQEVHTTILDRVIEGPLKAKRCAKSYGCDDPFHCMFRLANTCEWVRLAHAFARIAPQDVTVTPDDRAAASPSA